MLLRYLQVVFLLFFAASAVAHEDIGSIYHPLPLQERGLYYDAKEIFPGADGGLWLHDTHGNIRFFDGQQVLPRIGSIIDKLVDEVAFLNQAFWYVEGNKLYKAAPAQKSELVVTLNVGIDLKKVGSSKNLIWMTDNQFFYVYNPDTSELIAHSLYGINLQTHQNFQITDALLVKKKWVMGTASGVYIYQENQMVHAKLSGDIYVEELHYSESRQELLVGGRHRAVLIDINKPKQVKARIGHSWVRAIIESKEGYWVGTEHGLYTYQFSDQKVREIETNHHDGYALSNDFIYSLANDKNGGVWIATSREIRYFSLFSDLFERIRCGESAHQMCIGSINQIVTDEEGTHWIATDTGLYTFRSGIDKTPQQRLYKPVHDLALHGNFIWLAMDRGIVQYQKSKYRVWPRQPSALLSSRGVRRLAIDSQGVIWFDSQQGLVRYRIGDSFAENIGYNWVANHQAGRITHLFARKNGQLLIGTDHGTYLHSNGRIQYLKASGALGQNIDMVDTKSSVMWFVNSYGLYFSPDGVGRFNPVTLDEPNIRVLCALSTEKGVWSASSKGLSFYKHNGELTKHFSAPFGLVNNEFLPNACSYDPIKDELIFGSRYGVVLAKQSELFSAVLPESRVLFSQIVVNNEPYKIAFESDIALHFPYDSTVAFIFGVLPDFDQSHLQYRLSGENESGWVAMQGSELAFNSLFPGEYELHIRTEAEAVKGKEGTLLRFVVKEPWYLTSYAFFLFAVLSVLSVVLLMYWRSVSVLRRNRYLQELVDLKTSQLENQGQILIANNHQLRLKLNAYGESEEQAEKKEPKELKEQINKPFPSSADRSEVANKEDAWLVKVYELIEKEYMNPEFGTSLACRSLYVSERSLQRKLKSLTGKTFTEHLQKARLEKACELLLSGGKISDVAFDSGFNDPSYFSQRFKNYFGISPSKFIESHLYSSNLKMQDSELHQRVQVKENN